jgi:hypothetical protein
MAVLEYEFDESLLTRLRPGSAEPRGSGATLSPELVLVAPPEVAEAAREALPDLVPFDEWLRRARLAESRAEPIEWDWEYARPRPRFDRGAAAFALGLAGASVLPVVLLALWRVL